VEEALSVQPFPWNRLITLPRESVGMLADTRRALARSIDETKIAEALSDLLGERATIHVSSVDVVSADPEMAYGLSLALVTSDDAVRVRIDLDRQLARALVARVVGRPAGLGDPRAATSPEIDGALLAIVCAVARRAHGASDSLRPMGPGSWALAPGERALLVRGSLAIGSDSYAVNAVVQARRPFSVESGSSAEQLEALGALPISLPVVVGVAAGPAGELFGMATGDVFLPGEGWTVARSGTAGARGFTGKVILTAPNQDQGITGTLGEDGSIVVVGVGPTSHDVEATMSTSKRNETTATSEVILDAPLVVRVELGSVTLAAREWAALGPGDVIAVGRRVSEPIILRIAGQEVAHGELVDIEGELGVRIRDRIGST
jgi:flagellar motor switch/type III secretory pathway protein FliN